MERSVKLLEGLFLSYYYSNCSRKYNWCRFANNIVIVFFIAVIVVIFEVIAGVLNYHRYYHYCYISLSYIQVKLNSNCIC